MALEIRLSPRAKADLEAIFLYTAERWSLAQADEYVLLLEDAMTIAASFLER